MSQDLNETDAYAETQLLPKIADAAIAAPTASVAPKPSPQPSPKPSPQPSPKPSIAELLAPGPDPAAGAAKPAPGTAVAASARPPRAPIPVPPEFFRPVTGTDAAGPETPAPGTPAPGTPAPETPATRIPVPGTPAPEIPVPANGALAAPSAVAAVAPAPVDSARTAPPPVTPTAEPAAVKPSARPAESPAVNSTVSTVASPSPTAKPAPKTDNGGFNGPPRWQENVPFDETGVLLRPELLRQQAMYAETELIAAVKDSDAPDTESEAAKAQQPGFWTSAWPRRALLALIMAVQALLSLRNNNSPFVDESLYLYSGHLELGHMLYGTSTGIDFWSYFSGAPVLYPPLGALADQIGGVFAARLLSLLFMLGTTGLLYLITRRLFGTRAGLCAAALYSCTEATIFLGGLATYDAPALFLLALATWIVVRFAAGNNPLYLLAIFPAALAVGTKYVSLLFVPTVFALALLVAVPHSRRWALIRPVALSLGTACVLYTAYRLAGTSAATGISATTTSRAQGTDTVSLVMKQAAQYGGVVFLVALTGAVFVVGLPRRHAHPAIARARWQRGALVAVMAGTALLAPVYQAHLHTAVSLQKHVGFGLFFAAPLAGYGLVRVVGPHFHRVQLGIGVLVLTFALGMGQSLTMFHSWPNSYASVAELVKYQKAGAHYLFADGPNVIYQLRGDRYAEPSQFSDAFSFGWWNEQGKYVTGEPAYADAIQAGYFQVVVYDFTSNPPVEQSIAQDLYNSPIYKLVAKIYSPTSNGAAWSYVWVRK